VYTIDNPPPKAPVCKDLDSITLSLTLDSSYTYDHDKSAFHLIVLVYHNCGKIGMRKGTSFSEAVELSEGLFERHM